MGFLDNIERAPSMGGSKGSNRYMKFNQGENKFRIVGTVEDGGFITGISGDLQLAFFEYGDVCDKFRQLVKSVDDQQHGCFACNIFQDFTDQRDRLRVKTFKGPIDDQQVRFAS